MTATAQPQITQTLTLRRMKASDWAAYQRREREREEMTDTLNRGVREISKSMNDMTGWADRIMRAVLAPMGSDIKTIWDASKENKNGGAAYKHDEKR
jgi:hypothetical protein